MRFNWKRVLSLVMALALIISFVPHNALHSHAEETEEPEVEAQASTTLPKGQSPEQVAGDGLTWIMDGGYYTNCGNSYEHTHGESCYYLSCDHKDGHLNTCYENSTSYAVCPGIGDTHAHTGTAELDDVFGWNGSTLDWNEDHPAYPAVRKIYDDAIAQWKAENPKGKWEPSFIWESRAILAVYTNVMQNLVVCYTTTEGAEPVCGHVHSEVGGACYSKLCVLSEHTHIDPDCYAANWKEVADINNNEVADSQETLTIIFVDEDGTELQKLENVAVGEVPVYTGETPVKAADAQYTYTFGGWDKEIVAAMADATYTAVYTTVTNEYTVTFLDEDGTELWSGKVAYGETPTCAAPSKEGYRFAGWTPAVNAVTGDITYTATYTKDAAQIGETVYSSLAAAIADVKDGETIVLLGDCAENVTIKQTSDKSFTIDGAGKTYTGTITVDGNKRHTGKETLTIKNVNFVLEGQWQSGIDTVKGTYAHNITVDNCTFTGKNNEQYGIRLRNVYDVTLTNSNGTKLYDMVYGQYAVDGFAAENVIVTDSNLGFWLPYATGNISFDTVTAAISGTAITFNNNNVFNVVLTNCNISGLRMNQTAAKSGNMSVKLVGNNIISRDNWLEIGDQKDNVITVDLSESAGNQTIGNVSFDATYYGICNTETEKVYQIKKGVNVAKIGEDKYFTTLEAAVEAAAYDDTIVVLTDIDLGASGIIINGTKAEPKKITIDLNGNHMIVSNDVTVSAYQYSHVTLVNGTVKGNSNGGGSLRVHSGSASYESGTLVLGNGLSVTCGNFGTGVFAKTGRLEILSGATITAGENNGKAIVVEDANAFISGGTIIGSITLTGEGSVSISGGLFSEEPKADWIVEGRTAVYLEDDAMWAITNAYTITFVDENGNVLKSGEVAEGKMPKAPEIADREYYTYSWNPAISVATGNVEYKLVWTPNNDVNTNGVADEEETVTITVVGDGSIAVSGAVSIGDGKYVFDSSNPSVTVIATPVVEADVSKTYVASIAGADLTYGENFVATAVLSVKNGDEIVVTYEEAKFVLDEDGQMRFYVGMEDPDYETLYNAVIVSPEYSSEFVGKNVLYLARTEGEYEVDLSAVRQVLSEVKVIGSLLVNAFDEYTNNGKITVTLGEKWLNVGDQLEEGSINDVIDSEIALILKQIEDKDYWEAIKTIGAMSATITEKAGNIGCHAFGANTLTDAEGNVQEKISVVYEDASKRLSDNTLVVTLVDDRAESFINAEDISVVYRDYTAESLVAAIAPALVDADGNPIAGDVILDSKIKGTEAVGTFEVTFEYKGSYDYKPATKTVIVTVTKAPASIDIPNVQVKYGETYNVDPAVTLGNQYGDPTEITESLIQFMIGLDIAEFDYNSDGVTGLNGKVQLILPADIQELLDAAIGLTGGNTSDGMEMSLSDLMKYLDMIPDTSLESLNQALEAIMSVVEAGDLTIVIGGELPTNAGAYLYGAVSTSANYETAFDVAYIVIAPALKQVYLDWNYTDTNGIFTWELLKHVDLGATAYDDAAFTTVNEAATAVMQNLFFGIDENGELVIKMHGKNTELEALEASLGNGAYTQLAFTLDIGNELVYAMPIARAFVIVPNVSNVQIVDAEGNALDAFTFTFDKTAKQLYVMVDGKLVECDITYAGIQTNVKVYEPTTSAPVHAGAYTAVVTYIGRDANGEVVSVGVDLAALVIEPAQSTIEVTGGNFVHDGQPHGVIVNAPADVTLISGAVTFSGDVEGLGVEDVQGILNVDFPKWLDAIFSEQFADAYANGVSTESFLFKLEQHEAAMLELGVTEEIIRSLTNLMKNLPDNVVVRFDNNVTYSDPGFYAYLGIVTDSDYIPSYDTGLVVIQKEGMVVDMLNTTVTYNGKGQFVNIYNPDNSDYVAIIIDRENNIGNIILEDDLNHLVTLLENALDRELPKTINVAELMAAIDKVLTNLESAQLPADAATILAQVREALAKLPQSGVVYINGEWLPTNVGEYEFYGATYSLAFATNLTEATLTIVPAQVTVTLEDKNVHIGDDMPELTYTVSGLIEGETLEVVLSCEAENAETAGEYKITATYVENKNYAVTVVDATLTVEGHSYEADVTDPTCTEGGYTTYTCSVCGDNYVADEVAALGHTKETIPAVEATFDNVGWTEGVKCSVCGETLVAPVEIPKKIAVAQIGETRYETLQAAVDAAKNGETVVVLVDLDEDVTITQKKNVAFTIDGAGKTYTGTMTLNGIGRATDNGQALTIQNVNFVADTQAQKSIATPKSSYVYNVTISGCTFTGIGAAKDTAYGIHLRHVYNITVRDTIGTDLIDLVYGQNAVTGLTVVNVTVTDSVQGIWLAYPTGDINFTGVTITDSENRDVGFYNYSKSTVTFTDCEIGNIAYNQKGTAAMQMIFNDQKNNLSVNETNDKLTVVLNKVDATVTAVEGLNAVSGVDGYIVVYENGVYYLAKPVAQNVQTGKMYAELSKAIAEVENGETIIMLVDIDEDVTIKQEKDVAFTIDGGKHIYSGTMTVNGIGRATDNGQALTIQNVNFVADTQAQKSIATPKSSYVYNVTISGCTFTGIGAAKDTAYGIHLRHVYNITVRDTIGTDLIDLVYGQNAVTGLTVVNVTVTDSVQGIWLAYPTGDINFTGVTITDSENRDVGFYNYSKSTVTFTDCEIGNIAYNQKGTAAMQMIFNDQKNNLSVNETNDNLTVVLNKVDATVTAVEGLNVVSGVDGYVVAYKDGYYYLAKPVASVNGTLYGSIQDAVNAAGDGDTVMVIADHEMTWNGKTFIDGSLASMVVVAGKSVTIDLNGKAVTVDANKMNGTDLYAVFAADDNGHLTMKDSIGTGSVNAEGVAFAKSGTTAYCMLMAYKTGTTLTIENGSYYMASAHDSLIYSGGNECVTVNDGYFTLGNVGYKPETGNNGKPWIFNVLGQNDGHTNVNGGTYNADIDSSDYQYWIYEVSIHEDKCSAANGNGTWTVVAHVHGTPVKENEKAGNCTEDGSYDIVTYCDNCDKELKRETFAITAKGHVDGEPFDEMRDTNNDGFVDTLYEVVKCSVCGEEISAVEKASYVCWNPATGTYYSDLSDALAMVSDANAEEIEMLKSVTELTVIVYPGTTLDLNGKTVEAMFVVGLNGSHVTDNTRKGLLKVASSNITLAKDNKETPIRDNTLGGYHFGKYYVSDTRTSELGLFKNADGSLTYNFITVHSGPLKSYFTDNGASDNEIKVLVHLTWIDEEGNKEERYLTYNDGQIAAVANGGKMYTVKITGYEGLKDLTIQAMVVTEFARVENCTELHVVN